MNKIEYHKKLFQILSSTTAVKIDASFVQIDKPQESIEEKLNEIGAKFEHLAGGVIRIITNSINTTLFANIEEFRKVRKINSDSNILILAEPVISYFDCNTYVKFELSASEFLINNAKAYLEFQDFLKQQEKETDESFHFVDSFNKDFRKLSFVSLSEKGRLTIKYDLAIPELDRKKDYSKALEKFKFCFDEESNNLPKFLKSTLIHTASSYSAETRFKQLFESLEDIVIKAKMNFEVYLNNLSIDKIKKDYDELKSKYFRSLSDILSKLTNKIIALPIAISATLLAIDKVDDVPFFLYFLLFAILVTSIYLSLLLRIHFSDLKYVEKIFYSDYNTLLSNNFFTKYPDESELFEEIKDRITKRINFLKLITESYFWILNFSNVIIIGYILNKIGMPTNGTLFISIALLIVIALIRNYIIEKEKKESGA